MAVPIIAVYQIGVVTILFSIAKQRRALKKANKRAPLSNEQFQSLIAIPLNNDELPILTPLTTQPSEVLATASTINTTDTQTTNTLLAIEALEAIDLDTKLETELESALAAEITSEHTFELGSLEDELAQTPVANTALSTSQTEDTTAPKPIAAATALTVAPTIATHSTITAAPLLSPTQSAAITPNVTQKVARPVTRAPFRSIDGIVRQRVIRPIA